MNLQDAASLTIPEGGVRNIRDGNGNLLWSSVGYNVRYDGDTYQQTYSGYQLLPTPYASGDTRTHRGITYAVNPDGTITMNGQNDGTASSAYFFVDRYGAMPLFELEAGTYYFIPNNADVRYEMYDGTNYYSFNSSNNYTVTFANSVSIRQIYTAVTRTNTTNYDNYKLYPMLTKLQNPTTADYEPYTGGIPAPSPDYPQPIQVVTGEQTVTIGDGVSSQSYEIDLTGKNLFDKDNANILVSYFDSSVTTITPDSRNRTIFIPCSSNTTYTVSKLASPSPRSIGYTEVIPTNGVQVYGITNIARDGTTGTITTGASAKYLAVRLWSSSQDTSTTLEQMLDSVQIELGPTATSYAPYYNYELCKIGTYQDYIYKSGDDWYVHKEVDKYVFDGDESWHTTPYGTNSWILTNVIYFNFVSSKIQIMSNLATGIAHADRNTTTPNVMYSGQNNVFNYRNTSFTTLSALQTATKDSYVYYAIASPTDTKITNATLISQLDAVHNWLIRHDYSGTVSGNLPIIINRTGLT